MTDSVAEVMPQRTPTVAQSLLERPIVSTLARLATPNILSMLASTAVGITESWYIGRLGTLSLAGLALVFPMFMLMNMLAAGALGGAIASAVARALGAGQPQRAQALALHAVCIALAASALFMVLFLLGGTSLFAALGAGGAVLEAARSYSNILFTGGLSVWLFHTFASVLRGTGDMRTPASVLAAVAMAQIALTGILTQGWGSIPAFGLPGAAIAAIVAYGLGALELGRILLAGKRPVRLQLYHIPLRFALFADILRVGLMAAISPLQRVLTVILMTGLVSRFGPAALAGYGIGARLELLMVPMVFGIGSALVFMVGTHIGAGALARAHRVAWIGAIGAALITGSFGLAGAIAPLAWGGLFTSDPAALQSCIAYLRIVGPCYCFYGLGLALYFASQGAGKVLWPVLATCVQLAITVGGGALAVLWLGGPLHHLYILIAIGIVAYGAGTALAITLGAWGREPLHT
jgi:putative MATE family efflux protein